MVELPEEDVNSDDRILDEIVNQISESKNLHIDDIDTALEWNCTSSLMLDSTNLNCGKCSKCGQWTTDREKPNPIQGISNGATVDEKLLCDECLQFDYKWAF